MIEIFGWLATSAVTIIAVVIVWFVMKYAFKWAVAGPWGVLLLIVSAVITIVAARLFLVPLIDDLYTNVKGDVSRSAMAADVVTVLGAAPGSLGFTGQGASVLDQSQGNPFETAPTTGGQQTQTGTVAAAVVANPTVFEFAHPYVVTPTSNTIVLEYTDGHVVQVEVTGTTPTACAIDLRRRDVSGNPTYAFACPTSDGVTFALSQVTLPVDWPQLPTELLYVAPEGVGGGGEGVSFNSPDMGQCVATELVQKGIAHSSEFGTNWLPAGSSWMLISPNWGARAFTLDQNETWTLISNDWDSVSFPINGELARQMGGKTGGGKTSATVIGTGPVPTACR